MVRRIRQKYTMHFMLLATVERRSRRYDDKAQFLHSNIAVAIAHGKQYNSSDPDPAALLLSAQKLGINLLFAFHYAQIVGIMDIVTALGIKFIFFLRRGLASGFYDSANAYVQSEFLF